MLIKENPRYGDFSDPVSYQDSLNLVLFAQQQFEALDSRVRERFLNDPARFLEFTNDPKNMDEMIQLGLAIPRQTNEQIKTNEKTDAKTETKAKHSSKKDPDSES